MHYFKKFFTDQRNIELEVPYIIINVNISPKIHEYLLSLEQIPFNDGEYHKYCGQIKVVINNFINYWTDVINECIKEADYLLYSIDKKGFMELIEHTIVVQNFKQQEYIKAFSAENLEELNIVNELNDKLKMRLTDLQDMKKKVNNYENLESVKEFLKYHLDLSISKKNEAFELAHSCIARRLAADTNRIRVSFEEILLRLNDNLKKMKEQNSEELNKLMEDLYEANKDRLLVSRQEYNRNSDMAEVEYAIEKIRGKIECHESENPMAHLEEEVAYWEKRLEEFGKIEQILKKSEKEIIKVTEYLERFNALTTTEHPGPKKTCWDNMGENYRRRKAFLEAAVLDTSKALMTFFAVRGNNRVFYKNKIGKYTIDDYGHQQYFFDYGKKVYHSTCDGDLVQYFDTDKYYYDKIGRYILGSNGEKVYQCAPCTSTYNLNQDDLLEKTTKDCGHSEVPNPKCALNIKDPNVFEILPRADQLDIKKTMKPEVSKYIWDSIAYILPQALYDVGMKRPNNPIYYLANRLIHHKYHKNTIPQLQEKMKEAEKFKADIYQKRKEKAMADAKEYRAKQVMPRKPEESDDTEAQQVLATLEERQQLKDQLTYYDYY